MAHSAARDASPAARDRAVAGTDEPTAAGGSALTAGSAASAGGAGLAAGSADGSADGGTGSGAAGAPARREPTGGRWLNPATAAVLTWLVTTPVAFFLPKILNRNPLYSGAPAVPVTAAFVLVVAVFVAALRWRRANDLWAGVAAGLGGAWMALMLRSALVGTPFPFGGLTGDGARSTAAATRYTEAVASSDTLLPGLPSEYPPLYFWLIGRTSVLVDHPAWRLVADFDVLFMSASVLAGFLLWRRLVNDWLAVTITALSLATWSDPRKAYEVLTLMIFVPWLLEVFTRPPRRRMHWLAAGLLGGLIVMTYQAWLVYASIGLVALLVLGWRTEPDRWAYLRRFGLVVAVAFVVSAWYVVPFVWAVLTDGGQQVSDLYPSTSINTGFFPFLQLSPIGILQLVGLLGLIWLWRDTWWARPLLIVIIGVYAYRLLAMVRYVLTGHSGFLHYSFRLYTVLLTVAGVLVLAQVLPLALRRLGLVLPRVAGPSLLAVLLAWAAFVFSSTWMPPYEPKEEVRAAQTEPLPGGGYPRYAPKEGGRGTWFPVTEVERVAENVLGPEPRRQTLSADPRLFSYLPWPGYLEIDRTAGSTLSRWDDRIAEVRELVATSDPDEFAERSASTRFGPIDIFVFKVKDGDWMWGKERFEPGQFADEHWVVETLPNDYVMAVRR